MTVPRLCRSFSPSGSISNDHGGRSSGRRTGISESNGASRQMVSRSVSAPPSGSHWFPLMPSCPTTARPNARRDLMQYAWGPSQDVKERFAEGKELTAMPLGKRWSAQGCPAGRPTAPRARFRRREGGTDHRPLWSVGPSPGGNSLTDDEKRSSVPPSGSGHSLLAAQTPRPLSAERTSTMRRR